MFIKNIARRTHKVAAAVVPIFMAAEQTTYESTLNTTITLPAGVQAGERLIVFVTSNMNGETGLFTDSSGWTRVTHQVSSATNSPCSALFEKTATGSDELIVTCGADRIKSAVSYRFKDVNGVNATARNGISTGGNGLTTAVTVSPARPFTCIASIALEAFRYPLWPPSNYADEVSNTYQGDRCSLFTARRSIASASSETPATWAVNVTNAKYITITAAVY